MRSLTTLFRVVALVLVLLLFFTSIELMGDSFKLLGKGFAEALIETTSNPFVGIFIGILATSLVQSSSTVTSMTVALVAGGGISISGAIPIIMGANIGTSVTNTIVSLGSITRKDEFRRAIAGATVHDFFNLLAVALLFPLELGFQLISRTASVLTDALKDLGGMDFLSPVKVVIDPVAGFVIEVLGENGIAVLVAGLLLLFISLRYLVTLLKALVLGRAEGLIHKYVFGRPLVAMLFGVLLTVLVQSSSITTSLTVPIVGAGIITVAQIFPFVLGANVGTTLTALLAALVFASNGGDAGIAALTVAFAHLMFNLFGILAFYPIPFMSNIPIRLSEKLGELAVKNRGYAIGYVLTVFFVIPLTTIVVTHGLDIDYESTTPDILEQTEPAADTTSVQREEVSSVPVFRLSTAGSEPHVDPDDAQ